MRVTLNLRQLFGLRRWGRQQQGIVLAAAVFALLGGGLFALTQRDAWFDPAPQEPTHGPKMSSLTIERDQGGDAQIAPKPIIIQQAPPPMTAAPPAPVPAASDVRGIAAGGILTSLSQAALEQYFIELKALGAGWVRWDINWAAVQPDGPSSYKWDGPDRIAAAAQKYGIRSLGIITYTPVWARVADCRDSQFCAPADPAAFGAFARQAASRYKDRNIHHWEIWNEPNYASAWQPAANVAAYAAVLKAAWSGIKTADQSAVIVTGGLAPAATKGGSIAPNTFVQGLYTHGARNSFDILGLHPYSYPVVASYQAAWNAWQQMNAIRQTMATEGDGAKKIWATEYGAPTGGPGQSRVTTQLDFTYPNDFMTETAQSQIAEDAVTLYRQNQSWLTGFFWYSLKDNGTSSGTSENFFGLLRFDGGKKPSYASLERLFKE